MNVDLVNQMCRRKPVWDSNRNSVRGQKPKDAEVADLQKSVIRRASGGLVLARNEFRRPPTALYVLARAYQPDDRNHSFIIAIQNSRVSKGCSLLNDGRSMMCDSKGEAPIDGHLVG